MIGPQHEKMPLYHMRLVMPISACTFTQSDLGIFFSSMHSTASEFWHAVTEVPNLTDLICGPHTWERSFSPSWDVFTSLWTNMSQYNSSCVYLFCFMIEEKIRKWLLLLFLPSMKIFMLGKKSSRSHFLIFYPENILRHFKQIASLGDT